MTPRCVLHYDLRSPGFGAPLAELYGAALDQAAWADERGFTGLRLPEHHGTTDSYLPSSMVFGSAAAARTSRLRLELFALILPLHHPLRAAEDLAVLDLVSGGRLDVTVAAGYRLAEHEMFGADPAARGRTVEEAVTVLRQAWTGEPFEFRGTTVRVTPRPLQRPGPPVFLGGTSAAAARRAARVADGFRPNSAAVFEHYERACAELGRTPGPAMRRGSPFLFVARDPERAWAHIRPHVEHEMRTYREWHDGTGIERDTGRYRALTPEDAVRVAREADEVLLHPLVGGLPPELSWECLELFASDVLPHLQREPA